jgi:hypothetical protein
MYPNVVALADEPLDEVRADEASAAGDKHPHCLLHVGKAVSVAKSAALPHSCEALDSDGDYGCRRFTPRRVSHAQPRLNARYAGFWSPSHSNRPRLTSSPGAPLEALGFSS